MPATFSRTLRSMDADKPSRRNVACVAGLLMLGGWLAWLLLGRVSIYEASESARLEVEKAAHPLAARVAGQVVTARLQIGAVVEEGDVLVELDSEAQHIALEQAKKRLANLGEQLGAIEAEIAANKNASAAHLEAQAVAIQANKARQAAADAGAEFAETQAALHKTLGQRGVASEEKQKETQAEAKAKRAAAQALRIEADLLAEQRRAQELDRQAEIVKLERERVAIAGQVSVEKETIRDLEREVRHRRIVAPIAGRIGNATELRVGAVVQESQELASIIPAGKPRVVAFFPAASVGRIQPGQPARLRLDGFPWTQFGTPLATVEHAGNEPLAGRVRVELALDLSSAPAIPLEHGLTGTLEVEVERLSPAEVVLRAAGRLLTGKSWSTPRGAAGERP